MASAELVEFDAGADEDSQFFKQHFMRLTHIRPPRRMLLRSPQRAVRYVDECEGEFWSLGEHDKNRRRIILTRAGFDGKPLPDGKVLKIPFLLFADETVEDRDDILLPIIEQIMKDAAAKYVGG